MLAHRASDQWNLLAWQENLLAPDYWTWLFWTLGSIADAQQYFDLGMQCNIVMVISNTVGWGWIKYCDFPLVASKPVDWLMSVACKPRRICRGGMKQGNKSLWALRLWCRGPGKWIKLLARQLTNHNILWVQIKVILFSHSMKLAIFVMKVCLRCSQQEQKWTGNEQE